MAAITHLLTNWSFAMGDSVASLEHAQPVHVPHTWSIDEEGQYHVGTGWYRTVIPASVLTAGERAFLYFHGIYRDADVYVNDQWIGQHRGSGYTPFTVEITQALQKGSDAIITVRADNRFSTAALPYDKSFDWANDGGIYRPVELWLTGLACISDCLIQAKPVIATFGTRQMTGDALLGVEMKLDSSEQVKVAWALYRGADDSITPIRPDALLSGTEVCKNSLSLSLTLGDATYWHFDAPELYTLQIRVLDAEGRVTDQLTRVIGFRELKLTGETWSLNGEPVRIPGMEWMPGSDPSCGSAESAADQQRMLRLLRESNSILTRFHWQQDDQVFDWCDRHGILVQEEIPFWGKMPEGDPEKLWPIITMQMEEMIRAHRHHPCIISWGVGNELSGHTWPVQHYVRRAAAFAHAMDPGRLVNYVTNTAWKAFNYDASADGDVLMINDYIGTWEPTLDQHASWDALLAARPGRAFLPSEFGLCEPAFPGGDAERERVFLAKTNFYRKIPSIVGTIYFCLNDYRTHMGEEGQGSLCRRVHGSASMTGEPKPSYDTVQREHAPFIVQRNAQGLLLTCRADLPRYTVSGYTITDGMRTLTIPTLEPGEKWLCDSLDLSHTLTIRRPNGDPVLELQF